MNKLMNIGNNRQKCHKPTGTYVNLESTGGFRP